MTFSAGSVLTAAQLNTYVRDNLSETAPAKATAAGQYFVATAANAIAARTPDSAFVATTETTTSTSYGNLSGGATGPAVTVTTGAKALVLIHGVLANNTTSSFSHMAYAVSGATTAAADDARCIFLRAAATNQSIHVGGAYLHTGLTPGSNTFTAQYRVSANTGTFENRGLAAFPL